MPVDGRQAAFSRRASSVSPNNTFERCGGVDDDAVPPTTCSLSSSSIIRYLARPLGRCARRLILEGGSRAGAAEDVGHRAARLLAAIAASPIVGNRRRGE